MKVLLIGYGSIGKRHYHVLKKALNIKEIDIVTKQSLNNIKTFQTIEEVENIEGYDYFIIASETYKHYNQLVYLEHKVKDKIILVEKPLFINKNDTIIKNNKVYVGYNLRFHPILQEIKNIKNNIQVLYVNIITGQYLPDWRPDRDYRDTYSASKKKGGGVLFDLSHEIDYVQWLFGYIKKFTSLNMKISNLDIDSNDLFTAIGTTENKILINVTLDYISKIPLRKIVIYCNEKTIIGDLITNELLIKADDVPLERKKFKVKRNDTYIRMHQAILNNQPVDVCDYKMGLRILKFIDLNKQRINKIG